MAQPENIWMRLASLVVTSVNPGTPSHTVALIFVIVFSLATILPPLKPSSVVKALNKTVNKTYIHYDEHKDMLDESARFDVKVKRYARSTG